MLLFCSHTSLLAQSDSNILELGRIRLHKDFTQTISIEGKDLEKMPFTNLSEAVKVWFMGAFSSKDNISYVVDGVVAMDANLLSIQDIQEVTLVLNAAAHQSGTHKQQHLVLVTTRSGGLGRKGLALSGQTAHVLTDYSKLTNQEDPRSASNFYHQYSLTAYHNAQKLKIRATASYLRDVYPLQTGRQLQFEDLQFTTRGVDIKQKYDHTTALSIKTAPQLERLRLHASFELPLHKNHTVRLNTNYTGQFSAFEQTLHTPDDPQHYHSVNDYYKDKIHSYTAHLKLQSSLSKRLHNQ